MKFRVPKSKIERARELTLEIDELIKVTPPYNYCLETDINSGLRATFAKKDIIALDKLVVRCGEVFHNLRSALDQAYFEAVSNYIPESSYGSLYFPFSKSEEKLESTIKSRLAHRVNNDFVTVIKSFKPFSGDKGNLLLTLIHEINIIDKHKLPIPTGDYTLISSEKLRNQIPDFPPGLTNCGFGQNGRDVTWKGRLFDLRNIGQLVKPTNHLYHKTIKIPVSVHFSLPEINYDYPVLETLKNMANEVERIINSMAEVLSRNTYKSYPKVTNLPFGKHQ